MSIDFSTLIRAAIRRRDDAEAELQALLRAQQAHEAELTARTEASERAWAGLRQHELALVGARPAVPAPAADDHWAARTNGHVLDGPVPVEQPDRRVKPVRKTR